MTTSRDTRPPSWLDASLWPWPGRLHPVPGGRVHVTDVGEGPPILFVHGTPTWSIDWRHLVADLSIDHRCLTVDHLGFGLSDRPAGAGYRPEDHALRFAAFADTLDLRDITVVMHDFGGPIALPWVLDHTDRIRRIVLLNTFAWRLDAPSTRFVAHILGSPLGRWLYRWANLSLRVIAPSAWGDRSKLSPELHAQHLAPFEDRDARVAVLWALARSLLGSEESFDRIGARLGALNSVEVDLIWGMKDPAFPEPHLRRWQAALPHARTRELPDAGHWPQEEFPEAVLDVLRNPRHQE
jgi:haloalkane dehalogenase